MQYKEHLSAASLRDNAKGYLNGKYGLVIRATLVFLMVSYGASWLASEIGNIVQSITDKVAGAQSLSIVIGSVLVSVVSVLVTLVLEVFNVGFSLFYLKLGCNHMPRVSDIFYGFKENFSKSFGVAFVVAGIGNIVDLPALVLIDLSLETRNYGYLLFAGMISIVSLIVTIVLKICFKMSYYIMADFPDYSATQVLAVTWKKMKHNKWRLFCLELSFIPYMLLGILSFGIAFLWINPLKSESEAQFYLDLVNAK